MKKIIASVFIAMAVTLLWSDSALAAGDTNMTSTVRVMNTTKVNDTLLTFEVWFKNTYESGIEYASGQYFWDFNKSFLNGDATLKIISSGMPTLLIPRNPTVSFAYTPGRLQFATNAIAGAGFGGYIESMDSVMVMKVALNCPSGFSTTAPLNMTFRRTVAAGVSITYYVGTVNTNVTSLCTFIDEFPVSPTSISPVTKKLIPNIFAMQQNFPNPFNPTSTLSYQLPIDSKVLLKVYDMTGREVATLVNGDKAAGFYTVPFNAINLASGVYIYRLSAEGKDKVSSFQSTKKMLLLK